MHNTDKEEIPGSSWWGEGLVGGEMGLLGNVLV